MKQNLFLACFALILFPAFGSQSEPVNPLQVTPSDSAESKDKLEISRIRQHLFEMGYAEEMMDALFGANNHFFPETSAKLEASVFMIDLLIEKGVYTEDQRHVLIFLAFEAHEMFTKNGAIEIAIK